MRWYCDESDYVLNYPVNEVVKAVYCNGCGKKHQLRQGTLSQEDLDSIEHMTAQATEFPAIYDMVETEAYREAVKHVKHDLLDEVWYPTPAPLNHHVN